MIGRGLMIHRSLISYLLSLPYDLRGENRMVNVAILGFGTVGSGVAEVLTTNGGLIDQRVSDLVRLKYILDVRDFNDSPYKDCFVKDFSVIENDPEVDIVVETIGGATVALDFTTRALKAGKSVVSQLIHYILLKIIVMRLNCFQNVLKKVN